MAHSKAEGAGREQMASLPEDWVFALDIGTRSVIGIVGQRRGDTFEVADVEVREHPSRAMVDGQIENIEQVAQVAGQVKESLESRLGMELRYVNVAAAGRALKTGRGIFSLDVGTGEPISSQQMYELEVGAIAVAREQVQKTQEITGRFYCVGHSVVRYHLDDYPFSTILGHKGEVAKAEVIATFLPTEVVDSLISAMTKIGCEISHMTLEPIAAMNAVIPPDLRLLNLALVDIGAGTSDIAISENGTVSAYTMATVAGDEVTEELIKKYLVEFQTAERMKHEAAKGCSAITYRDILGFDNEISLEETLTTLQPAVESLGEEICRRLLEVNGKTPAAVFLVGGGSLTPGLCQCVAQKLGLDERRVAIGGENYIKRVTGGGSVVSGPAFATPIGIALTASTAGTGKGFYVTVNEEKVRLFRNDRMSIMDVLLSSGYQYKDIMGQSGKPITYTVNGEKRIKRGGHLVPAELYLNGKEASISTPVNCEDEIRFIPAQSGEDAHLTLTDIGLDPCAITVNFGATPVQAGRFVTVNGKSAAAGQAIADFDAVAYTEAMTLRELCLQIGMEWREQTFLLGDVYASGDTLLQEGDTICYTQGFSPTSAVLEMSGQSSTQVESEAQRTASQFVMSQAPMVQTVEGQSAVEGEAVAGAAAAPPMALGEAVVQGTTAEHDRSGKLVCKDTEMRKTAAEQGVTSSRSTVLTETGAKRVTPQPVTQSEGSARSGRMRSAVAVRPVPASEKAKESASAPSISPVAEQEPQQPTHPTSVKPNTDEVSEGQDQGLAMTEPPVSLVGTEMLRNYPVGGMTRERQTGVAYPDLAASLQEEKSREQENPSENAGSETAPPERRRPAPGEPLRILLNGESRLLPPKQDHYDYLFVDLFTLVDIDPANPQGNIVLRLNGQEPSYVDELFMDDVAEIYWDGQGV